MPETLPLTPQEQLDEAWDNEDYDLEARLKPWADAYLKLEATKVEYEKARKERNRDVVRDLKQIIDSFPTTIEEFEHKV